MRREDRSEDWHVSDATLSAVIDCMDTPNSLSFSPISQMTHHKMFVAIHL